MIKANRTPHHQPEGSPGYADHPSLTPLRRGFFFSGRSGQQRDHLDLRGAAYMLLQAAERVVPGERFELPTNGLQIRGRHLTGPNSSSQHRCSKRNFGPISLAFGRIVMLCCPHWVTEHNTLVRLPVGYPESNDVKTVDRCRGR
jgi:hypothetical protein